MMNSVGHAGQRLKGKGHGWVGGAGSCMQALVGGVAKIRFQAAPVESQRETVVLDRAERKREIRKKWRQMLKISCLLRRNRTP